MKPPDWCPMMWDTVSCWPATAPGDVQTIHCPRYVVNFIYTGKLNSIFIIFLIKIDLN